MGYISKDPGEESASIDARMAEFATKTGMHIVHVLYFDGDDDTGDMAVMHLAPYMPRPGDKIELQNGRVCKVDEVYFKAAITNGFPILIPNVLATLQPR